MFMNKKLAQLIVYKIEYYVVIKTDNEAKNVGSQGTEVDRWVSESSKPPCSTW